jgi:hypothetical protein
MSCQRTDNVGKIYFKWCIWANRLAEVSQEGNKVNRTDGSPCLEASAWDFGDSCRGVLFPTHHSWANSVTHLWVCIGEREVSHILGCRQRKKKHTHERGQKPLTVLCTMVCPAAWVSAHLQAVTGLWCAGTYSHSSWKLSYFRAWGSEGPQDRTGCSFQWSKTKSMTANFFRCHFPTASKDRVACSYIK